MLQNTGTLEEMNHAYEVMFENRNKRTKFVYSIKSISKLESIYRMTSKKNVLFKHLERHFQKEMKSYIQEPALLNPINFVKEAELIDVAFREDEWSFFFEYSGLDFVYYYSSEKKEVDLKMIYKDTIVSPIIIHKKAIPLLKGLFFEFSSAHVQ